MKKHIFSVFALLAMIISVSAFFIGVFNSCQKPTGVDDDTIKKGLLNPYMKITFGDQKKEQIFLDGVYALPEVNLDCPFEVGPLTLTITFNQVMKMVKTYDAVFTNVRQVVLPIPKFTFGWRMWVFFTPSEKTNSLTADMFVSDYEVKRFFQLGSVASPEEAAVPVNLATTVNSSESARYKNLVGFQVAKIAVIDAVTDGTILAEVIGERKDDTIPFVEYWLSDKDDDFFCDVTHEKKIAIKDRKFPISLKRGKNVIIAKTARLQGKVKTEKIGFRLQAKNTTINSLYTADGASDDNSHHIELGNARTIGIYSLNPHSETSLSFGAIFVYPKNEDNTFPYKFPKIINLGLSTKYYNDRYGDSISFIDAGISSRGFEQYADKDFRFKYDFMENINNNTISINNLENWQLYEPGDDYGFSFDLSQIDVDANVKNNSNAVITSPFDNTFEPGRGTRFTNDPEVIRIASCFRGEADCNLSGGTKLAP